MKCKHEFVYIDDGDIGSGYKCKKCGFFKR